MWNVGKINRGEKTLLNHKAAEAHQNEQLFAVITQTEASAFEVSYEPN